MAFAVDGCFDDPHDAKLISDFLLMDGACGPAPSTPPLKRAALRAREPTAAATPVLGVALADDVF